jgi:hypothetical protein
VGGSNCGMQTSMGFRADLEVTDLNELSADAAGAGVVNLLVAGVEYSLAEAKSTGVGADEVDSLASPEDLLGRPRALLTEEGIEFEDKFLEEDERVIRRPSVPESISDTPVKKVASQYGKQALTCIRDK